MRICFSKETIKHLYRFTNIIKKLQSRDILIKIYKKKLYYIYSDEVIEIYLIIKTKEISKEACISLYHRNITSIIKGKIGKTKMIINIGKRYIYIKNKTRKYVNRSFLIRNYVIKKEKTKPLSVVFINTKVVLNISTIGAIKTNKFKKEDYVKFIFKERDIIYFTYDDFRILVIKALCSIPNTRLEVNISNLVLGILHKALITSNEKMLKMELYRDKLIFIVGNIVIKSHNILVSNINYKEFIKKEKEYNYITIKKEEIKEAISIFKKLLDRKNSSFIMRIINKEVKLEYITSELEKIKYKIEILKGYGSDTKIKLSTEFISEFVDIVKGKNILIGYKNKKSKIFFISKEREEEIIYCIMPLN
ncbi:hypothetical protein [Candidatus Vidania fulgoroideorum]